MTNFDAFKERALSLAREWTPGCCPCINCSKGRSEVQAVVDKIKEVYNEPAKTFRYGDEIYWDGKTFKIIKVFRLSSDASSATNGCNCDLLVNGETWGYPLVVGDIEKITMEEVGRMLRREGWTWKK